MELTPRTAPDPSGPQAPSRRRSLGAYAVLAVVLVGVGVVAYQGLTSASLYFYNADEAVAQANELYGKRIRVQGLVQDDIAVAHFGDGSTGVRFTISYNGEDLLVEHRGDPPELFKAGTPVVLEGEFASSLEAFMSDQILVKHDEQYEAEHDDRLKEAEDGESGGPAEP